MGACPACDAAEYVPLGTLGSREWRRCRACGIDYSLRAVGRRPFDAPPRVPSEAEREDARLEEFDRRPDPQPAPSVYPSGAW